MFCLSFERYLGLRAALVRSARYSLTIAGLCLAPGTTAAQPTVTDIDDRLISAWQSWLAEGSHPIATIAILRRDGALRVEGKGIAPGAPLPLASLSKPLTAACAQAVGLREDDHAAAVLGLELLDDPTLGALVTHTAGLWPDSTQNAPDFAPDAAGRDLQEMAAVSLARPQAGATAQGSRYNNENYAVIGAMIAAKTGDPYEAACQEAFLQPLDLQTATTDNAWGHHGPWGGWSMSAAEYSRFVDATFGEGSGFATDPSTFASAPLNEQVNTSLGAAWRDTEAGPYVWGFGHLCWGSVGNGSYFASYGGEMIVTVLYTGCVTDPARFGALDAALYHAAHPQN